MFVVLASGARFRIESRPMAHILIIDDDPQVRDVIRRMLETDGHVVREAADGNQGLKRYREQPADLVFCDLYMPVKEGLETLFDLRVNDPDAKVICISGGSASSSRDFLLDAKLLGASCVLHKPFSRDELLQAVRQSLG